MEVVKGETAQFGAPRQPQPSTGEIYMNTSEKPMRVGRALLLSAAIALTLAACGGGGSGGTSANSNDPSGTGPAPGGGSGSNTPGTGSGSNAPAPNPVTLPIIYLADQTTQGVDELYMVQASAPGTSVKINAPLVAGGFVYDYALSPDGQYVTYIADQDINGRYELYRVSLANPGVATKLNPPLNVNRDVMDFVQSSDGTRIVYRSDNVAENFFDLYIVDVANPGTSIQLNGALTPGGSVRSGYVYSPDGARVVYRADQQLVDRLELFSVDVASPGVSTKLNSSLVQEGDVASGFAFSPDSSKVAYVADQDVDGVLDLYAVALTDPGTTSKLNDSLVDGGDVCHFTFSPDSQRVAYCADQTTDEVIELYTVALSAPGNSTKLSPTLVAEGDVNAFYEFSADSSFVIYVADQEVDEKIELFRVDIASPGVATKINAPLIADGDVWDFKFRPDGTHIGYVATQEDLAIYELYEVALTSPGISTKLSAPMISAGLWQFDYTADSSAAIYVAEQVHIFPELYQVEVATPGAATMLNSPLASGGAVWAFINKAGQMMIP
jgi:Tol biopolymer transport system component